MALIDNLRSDIEVSGECRYRVAIARLGALDP
jgi:hypothetical protein